MMGCVESAIFSRFYRVKMAVLHPMAAAVLSVEILYVGEHPHDLSGISHPVLKAPPQAVRRNEIE